MPEHKCTFVDEITVKPDGANELDFSSTTYNVEFEVIGNIHDNADLLIIK